MEIAEIMKLRETDPEAYKEILKKHPLFKNAMEARERLGFEKGYKAGVKKARAKGIEKGIEKVIMRTAIILFNKGMDIPYVSKITGLTEDQLLEIYRREGLV